MSKKKTKTAHELTTREAVRELFGTKALIGVAKKVRSNRRRNKTTKK
jgi:hypothetical protein